MFTLCFGQSHMKSRPPLAHTLCPGATAALCWSVLKACMPSCALSARSSSEMPRLVSREHCHGGMKSCLPSDARIFTATLKPFILRLETFLCSKIRTICFLFSFVVVEPSSYRIKTSHPSSWLLPKTLFAWARISGNNSHTSSIYFRSTG